MGHGDLWLRTRSGFVVSHPFASKKANGWGTEILWLRTRTGLVVSHPFASKKANGWGTEIWGCVRGLVRRSGDQGCIPRTVWIGGFPPIRQKKGEWMGHGDLWLRARSGFVVSHP